jgi:hypothetical protein
MALRIEDYVGVLMALIDAQGSVVSKNALMERVWPDRIVEENNLQTVTSLGTVHLDRPLHRNACRCDRHRVTTQRRGQTLR